jgi:tetratricopeptide (TPR) repeat protein
MKTPFGPPFGFVELTEMLGYLDSHTPDEVLKDTVNWECDPTDLLVVAGIFYYELNKYEHTAALYKKAINELTFNPSLIAEDTNLSNAFAAFGFVLIKLQKFDEALDQLLTAFKSLDSDYLVIFGLFICYYHLNRIKDARICADILMQVEYSKLKTYLKESEIQVVKDFLIKLNDSQIEHLEALDNADKYHKTAINFFSAGNYQGAIVNYKSAIELYENSLTDLLPESTETALNINKNLSLALLDLSTLYEETKSQPIKHVITLLIRALISNRNLNDAQQNLLYYMGYVNSFLKTRKVNAISLKHIAKLYNDGYSLLQTPYPMGTRGRNWEGAINLLKEVDRKVPNLVYTHHLLGLAYEGIKMDDLAIDEWIKVYNLDPEFDFETRVALSE